MLAYKYSQYKIRYRFNKQIHNFNLRVQELDQIVTYSYKDLYKTNNFNHNLMLINNFQIFLDGKT